jgi:hypothetical protein
MPTTKTTAAITGTIKQLPAPATVLALSSVAAKLASEARDMVEYTAGEPIQISADVHIEGTLTIGEETEATSPVPDIEGLIGMLIEGTKITKIAARTPISSGEWGCSASARAEAADLIERIKNRLPRQHRRGAVRCQCDITPIE